MVGEEGEDDEEVLVTLEDSASNFSNNLPKASRTAISVKYVKFSLTQSVRKAMRRFLRVP